MFPHHQTRDVPQHIYSSYQPIYPILEPQNSPLLAPPSFHQTNVPDVNHSYLGRNDFPMVTFDISEVKPPQSPPPRNITQHQYAAPADPFEIPHSPPNSFVATSNDKKKCKRCGRFYEEATNTIDGCHYHSGIYKTVYKSSIAVGMISGWSCCKEPGRDAPGCATGGHIECKATTATLERFKHLSEQYSGQRNLFAGQQNIQEENLIDLHFDNQPDHDLHKTEEKISIRPQVKSKKERITDASLRAAVVDVDSNIVTVDDQHYIRHQVKSTDTVTGLAIKYDIKADEVKNINKLFKNEDLWTRNFILIPFRGQQVAAPDEKELEHQKREMMKQLIRRFQRMTKCKSDSEAQYYLEETHYHLEEALKLFQEDSEWEKHSQKRVPISQKC